MGGSGGTGVCDPLRFSRPGRRDQHRRVCAARRERVWPHGSRQNFEADLQAALKYGVSRGERPSAPPFRSPSGTGRRARSWPIDPAPVGQRPHVRCDRGPAGRGRVLSASGASPTSRSATPTWSCPDGRGPASWGCAADLRSSSACSCSAPPSARSRRGVMMLDEAWVFLGAGAEEMGAWGGCRGRWSVPDPVHPAHLTDLLEANLTNHISRGIILHTRTPRRPRRLSACSVSSRPRSAWTSPPPRSGSARAGRTGNRKPLFTYDGVTTVWTCCEEQSACTAISMTERWTWRSRSAGLPGQGLHQRLGSREAEGRQVILTGPGRTISSCEGGGSPTGWA